MARKKKATHRVFVYGTLRPKDKDNDVVPATHELRYYKLYSAGAFPYIVEMDVGDGGRLDVLGNVIEVDDKQLARLDQYEGTDRGLYTREHVGVFRLADEAPENVFAYVAGPMLSPSPIVSGDWFNQ